MLQLRPSEAILDVSRLMDHRQLAFRIGDVVLRASHGANIFARDAELWVFMCSLLRGSLGNPWQDDCPTIVQQLRCWEKPVVVQDVVQSNAGDARIAFAFVCTVFSAESLLGINRP